MGKFEIMGPLRTWWNLKLKARDVHWKFEMWKSRTAPWQFGQHAALICTSQTYDGRHGNLEIWNLCEITYPWHMSNMHKSNLRRSPCTSETYDGRHGLTYQWRTLEIWNSKTGKTAQVKPTTVAMAMWYRGQTATPLVAFMNNAIIRFTDVPR